MSRLAVLVSLLAFASCQSQPEFVPLFDGSDLLGWVNVNGAPDTWTVRDGLIVCSGRPYGVLRTMRMYENYVLELEWRHMTPGGNAGLFVHSDALPAIGEPFTRAIEAQVMDGNHGDVFAIQGATMTPDRPHPRGWMRSLPIEERANPAGQWNHYRLESRNGVLRLAVNGKIVSGGSEAVPRKGYICLESEGAEVHFRDIRIQELPSSEPADSLVAEHDQGFVSMYSGLDLAGWSLNASAPDAWEVDDWRLRATGQTPATLWSERPGFRDFAFFFDWHPVEGFPMADSAAVALLGRDDLLVHFGAADFGLVEAAGAATHPTTRLTPTPDEWNRLGIRLQGDTLAVSLNGSKVTTLWLDSPAPQPGPIGLRQIRGGFEVANLFVRAL